MKLYHRDIISFLFLILIPVTCGIFLFDVQLKIVELHENYDPIDDITYEKLTERYMADSFFLISGMIVFMIFIVVLTMTFSTHPMLTNIKIIKNHTTKISKGDFKTRISLIDNNDEVSLLCNDINEMATKLMELQEKLLKSERFSAIGQLSATLAHDIRNPLGIIQNSVEILKMDNPESVSTLERIEGATDRISHQVKDVLGYVGKGKLRKSHVIIADIIRDSLAEVKVPSNIKTTAPDDGVSVYCDPEKISAVFTNLILNAVQELDDHEGTISIDVEDKDDKSVIKVANSGNPIPEEDLSRLFEPLFTTKMEGTGLGLASCKTIIEAHNGSIAVSNNPVTFTIILPK